MFAKNVRYISNRPIIGKYQLEMNVKFLSTTTVAAAANKNDFVLFEEKSNKGIVILNRPKALNAINLPMVCMINEKLKSWESTKDMVIIKGIGDKAFCAGGDVRAVVENGFCEDSKNFFREEYRMNHLIGSYRIPYIALIDGITMGGGVGLSVHGKYRIATERTLFAMPETAIGLFPDVGGGYFLPRLPGKLGLFLGLTGFRLKGKDVQKCGFATHYIESSRLPELEANLLKITSPNEIDPLLVKMCPADSSEFVLEKHLSKINKIFSGNTVEDIIADLEKDGSQWSKDILHLLNKMSPISLKITKKQLDIGAGLSLGDCLKMEFRLAGNSLRGNEFKEGVRALLVDKDQNPKWNPIRLEDVTENHVKFFFSELPGNDELILTPSESFDTIKAQL